MWAGQGLDVRAILLGRFASEVESRAFLFAGETGGRGGSFFGFCGSGGARSARGGVGGADLSVLGFAGGGRHLGD